MLPLFPSRQIFEAEAASEAVFAVAVHRFQLQQSLTVGRLRYLYAAVCPATHNVVVLGRQFLEQGDSLGTYSLVAQMLSVGIEQRHDGVYNHQSAAAQRQLVLTALRQRGKIAMRLPVGAHATVEKSEQSIRILGIENVRNAYRPAVVQTGKLRQTDVRKVGRPHPQIFPQMRLYRLQSELGRKKPVFGRKSLEILVIYDGILVSLRQMILVQKSSLPKEDSLYLKQIVAECS